MKLSAVCWEKTFSESPVPTIIASGGERPLQIVWANNSLLELMGYSINEVAGSKFSSIVASETDPAVVEKINSQLTKGKVGQWEFQCCKKDGQEFLASAFNTPLKDTDGELRLNAFNIFSLGDDLSRLIHERNELRAIYLTAPGFIATTIGPNHIFTFANPSYEEFVKKKNLVGRRVSEALPDVAEQGFIELLDEVFRSGTPYLARGSAIEIVDPDDGKVETKYADFVYQPVRSASGKITGLFCEGYDVTSQHLIAQDLARVQSELLHVSRTNAMGTMAMTLAHELNQPLSAILNYAAGSLKRIEGNSGNLSELAYAFSEIEGSARRASEIIKNLRTFTSKRSDVKFTEFILADAIEEAIRLVSVASHQDIEFKCTVSSSFVTTADRVQIQQVIINLLRNACDAMEDSRTKCVTVSAEHVDDNALKVCVTDTGSGVSQEAAQNLFTFNPSSKREGMGIGLSICATIIENHGGKLWLEHSDSAGSEFCFILNLKNGEPNSNGASHPADPAR